VVLDIFILMEFSESGILSAIICETIFKSSRCRIENEIMKFLGDSFSFTGRGEGRNRFHHERWEPVIEGNSEKAKEIFDFLKMAEPKKEEDGWLDWGEDEELMAWIKSEKLWAKNIYIPANSEYGYQEVSLDEALKEVEGKRFYIVAVDMHF